MTDNFYEMEGGNKFLKYLNSIPIYCVLNTYFIAP